jgi:hypothetical protein
LFLPLADLDRVDLELLGQLGDGLGLLGGLQGELSLEGWCQRALKTSQRGALENQPF